MSEPLRAAAPCARAEHRPPAVPLECAHAHELVRNLTRPLCTGNRLELLSGEAATAALLRAIAGAVDHVNLCGELVPAAAGAQVAEALVDRLRGGVRVNLCCEGLDALGFAAPTLDRLAAAGVSLCRPAIAAAWPPWPRRALAGTPGPLLIADGRRALLGAGGIDEDGRPTLVIAIEGPAVRRLQQLFLRHWRRRSQRPVQAARYFPPLAAAGPQRLALFDHDDPTLQARALLGGLQLAHERVLLSTAASRPGHRLRQALVSAARRGVAVTLLHHGPRDAWCHDHPVWQALAHEGVEVHEQPRARAGPTELCTIDGVWAGFADRATAARLVLLDRGLVRAMDRLLLREMEAAPFAVDREPAVASAWLRCKNWLTQRTA